MPNTIEILSVQEIKHAEIDLERGTVYSYPLHGHVYYEILVYEPFVGEITVNNVKFNTELPTAVLITPNDVHSITVSTDTPARFYKLKIKRETMELFSDYGFTSTVTQNRDRVEFLQALCRHGYENSSDERYLATCATMIALSMQKSSGKIAATGKSILLIKKATDIINQRFQEPITLESVAAELHVSPQHLSNLFSRYAQLSFIEYLSNRRLNFAIRALQNGANVTEACFQSGYRNLSHFIRSFKKKYGVTPSKYAK